MNENYVQYGCGLTAPKEWLNFDVSETLRLQRIPFLGGVIKKRSSVVFPDNVRYGDIVKGLPVGDESCDGLFCSHTLEHLSLTDLRKALSNSYRCLRKGGIFRCIVPDLESAARRYIDELDRGNRNASIGFLEHTMLGLRERPRGLKQLLVSFYGNSHHLWMWDAKSLAQELQGAGFIDIRECGFGDCSDRMFGFVEEASRVRDSVALECKR